MDATAAEVPPPASFTSATMRHQGADVFPSRIGQASTSRKTVAMTVSGHVVMRSQRLPCPEPAWFRACPLLIST
jgi:hypothetical protein